MYATALQGPSEQSVSTDIHEHDAPPPELKALGFLVGRSSGEGWFGSRSRRFRKQVVGNWVARGHHLLLDMSAEYELGDDLHDRHCAVLCVSLDPVARTLIARAYTDSGALVDYRIEADAEGLTFADRVPHGMKAVAARKLLRPTERGYEETLQVDQGDGAFVDCSRIELVRDGDE